MNTKPGVAVETIQIEVSWGNQKQQISMRFPAAVGIGNLVREHPTAVATLLNTAIKGAFQSIVIPAANVTVLLKESVAVEFPQDQLPKGKPN
jgi:predicted membrane-bound mannosyltransferase